ncbi:MAG: hypothetical protein M3Q58_14825 [Bacteroidota bacterium]|nr:hypothetical protein [Bacteroidota bacterium]
MRILLYQIVLLFFVLAAFSCTKNKHSVEIRSLDSLYKAILIVEKKIVEIDSSYVNRTYEEIVRNVKFVQQDYNGTFDEKEVELFNEYKNIRIPINSFHLNSANLLQEIDFTKNQLKLLAEDMRKGSISEERAKEYFSDEYLTANKIHENSVMLVDSLNGALKEFQELHPRVQEFIKNIVNNQVP